MSDLVAFLRARLGEDEQRFRESFYLEYEGLSDRMLREVEAKRKILDSYVEVQAVAEANLASNSSESWIMSAAHPVLRTVLEALAAVWRDHPDYDPAWA